MKMLKETIEVKAYDEDSAQAFIQATKENGKEKGYEVSGYSITKKEKKSKGEVIAEGFLCKVTLTYSNFWDDLEEQQYN